MEYNHLRNIINGYKHRDTQSVALLEQKIEVRMRTVKKLTQTRMRTKPIKNIYVANDNCSVFHRRILFMHIGRIKQQKFADLRERGNRCASTCRKDT